MGLQRYLVELERPVEGWARLPQTVATARETAATLRREGVPVRFLRSVYVPEDDACFFLYEGPSARAVLEGARRFAAAARVTAAVGLGPAAKRETNEGGTR